MDLDFGHTVGFVSGQAVFNLPDSYTVNSLDGTTIVNNQFGAPAASVDEPGALLLLLSGFGLVVAKCGGQYFRRRR